jgi:glycosyltransferase involved in cell wall biosynthesis
VDCFPGWGGGENLVARQIQYLRDLGYQVSLLCPLQSPFLTDHAIAGVQTIGLPFGRQATNYTRRAGKLSTAREQLAVLPKLDQALRAIRPDLVYAIGSRSAKYVLPVARLHRCKLSWSAGNLYTMTRVDRWLIQQSTLVICASEAVRGQYAPFAKSADKLQVLYHGVNLSEFAAANPVDFRRSLNLGEHDVLVGVVGRISEAKGPFQFVRAVAPLLEADSQLHAAVIGAAAEQDQFYLTQMQEYVDHCAARAQFHLTGWRDDIPQIMKGLDVLVLPSAGEAFGIVVIEAMAAGKPVIAYAVGAVPEVIVDQVTGLHVPPGDVTALRQAIERLVVNRAERLRMGEAGRIRAQEHFDDDLILPRFAKLIATALAQ